MPTCPRCKGPCASMYCAGCYRMFWVEVYEQWDALQEPEPERRGCDICLAPAEHAFGGMLLCDSCATAKRAKNRSFKVLEFRR